MVCSAKPRGPGPPRVRRETRGRTRRGRSGSGAARQAAPHRKGTLVHLTSARRTLVVTAALGLALASAPAVAQPQAKASTNAPVKVSLTVKGPDGRLFKGKIKTKGHDVTTATGGTHRCDGTNGEPTRAPFPRRPPPSTTPHGRDTSPGTAPGTRRSTTSPSTR
ncbi:hypothetical protein STAN_0029 [Streptomyces sp. CBMAI 2042]|nr:hypothetical protein STAN_0029 [Streptomyces sp. CBMAI 2042]